MAKSAPELKCRVASNSMPQGYGRGGKARPLTGRKGWECIALPQTPKRVDMAKGAGLSAWLLPCTRCRHSRGAGIGLGSSSRARRSRGLSRDLSGGSVEQGAHRYRARSKHYALKYPRRYNWSYYRYWRPYQHRRWQFYCLADLGPRRLSSLAQAEIRG